MLLKDNKSRLIGEGAHGGAATVGVGPGAGVAVSTGGVGLGDDVVGGVLVMITSPSSCT